MVSRFRGAAQWVTCLVLAAIGIPRPLAGQVIADSGARVERLADGVFAIIHRDALKSWPDGGTDWPHGNTGVIVGDDAVLVIDATFLPSRAAADVALIRRLTNRPVRFLVNTHWHGDHTHGNGVYRDSFPGIRIVSSRPNRDWIAINQERFRTRATQPSYPSRVLLKQLEGMVNGGKDTAGKPLTPEQRTSLPQFIAERRRDVADMPMLKIAPPDSVFDQRLTIVLGRRRVELRDHGHANSPSDVTVFVPDVRVLFTGDIVVHPIPYAFASYPKPWVLVLRELESMSLSIIVPGHGPAMHDMTYVRLVRELIEDVTERAEPFAKRGEPIDSVRTGIDLTSWRRRFDPQLSPVLTEMWQESIVNALLPRVFQCLQGVTC